MRPTSGTRYASAMSSFIKIYWQLVKNNEIFLCRSAHAVRLLKRNVFSKVNLRQKFDFLLSLRLFYLCRKRNGPNDCAYINIDSPQLFFFKKMVEFSTVIKITYLFRFSFFSHFIFAYFYCLLGGIDAIYSNAITIKCDCDGKSNIK